MESDYINGYIQRTKSGSYEGKVSIDGISLPNIFAVFFTKESENYIWLKRKKVLEYNEDKQTYTERESRPQWEAYLRKQIDGNATAYKGEFFFMHLRYSIVGVWDKVFGNDKQRLNLFIERLPMSQQTIVNRINERNQNECK